MLNEALAPGTLPSGLRVYAIGDVHGCADRLAALHALIAADATARPVGGVPETTAHGPPRLAALGGRGPATPLRHAQARPHTPARPMTRIVLVHLGDYIDRGPDSARVLQRLLGPPPVPGAEMVNLVGNHEVMMLDAADPHSHPGAMAFWLENGGAETLASYGAAPHDRDPFGMVPDDHLSLLRRCALRWVAGDYLFVHAGVRPGVAMDRQDPFDLLWIREPFLSYEGDLPSVVVHGHTPAAAPSVRPHRIGIDTGACFGGDLTCLVLEDRRLGFLVA